MFTFVSEFSVGLLWGEDRLFSFRFAPIATTFLGIRFDLAFEVMASAASA